MLNVVEWDEMIWKARKHKKRKEDNRENREGKWCEVREIYCKQLEKELSGGLKGQRNISNCDGRCIIWKKGA